ncbi:30S ribosomal protein S15 [bacterium]|nr:30S ribosomal protein S15 [bacterium]
MLGKRKKSNIITTHKIHTKDTGSSEIQIALLSYRITELTKHLKKHKKDHHSRRGLLKMVQKRKKLLTYLEKNNEKSYNKIIKKLKLKK